MSKKIQILIQNLTTEIVSEVLRGFSLNKFRNLENQQSRLLYAKKHLPLIGVGSSRSTFALSGGKVIKIAGNVHYVNSKFFDAPSASGIDFTSAAQKSIEKGVAQNEAEVDLHTDPKLKPLITTVYDAAEDYSWVISEIVNPFKTSKEFEKATKIPVWRLWMDLLIYYHDTRDLEEAILTIVYKDNNLRDYISFSTEEEAEDWFVTNFVEIPLTKNLLTLIDAGLEGSDASTFDHWGISASGKIVLLDYGLSQDVLKKHYAS